jgi:hypothetical protein
MDSKMIETLAGLLIYVAGAVIIVWKFFDYLSNREQVKRM